MLFKFLNPLSVLKSFISAAWWFLIFVFEKLFVMILVTHSSMLWLVTWVILVDREGPVMKLLSARGLGWLHVTDVDVPVG
jgi:hypothetical protein